ncbi:MAG: helix-turn-helix transcriptional regulator [Bacillota bacterium]
MKQHDYDISAGTLYPLLHSMASGDLLTREEAIIGGKIRKYYTITRAGEDVLKEASKKPGN